MDLVVEPSGPHSHTVVFLHGRGDNAADFSESLQYSTDAQGRTLREALPSFRWVFPEAPLRMSAALPGGPTRQWFDVWNVADLAEREELQVPGLRESVARVRDLVGAEAARLGGRWERVVLAGISQGGATAVHTLLNLAVPAESAPARRLGALVCFASRLPLAGRSLAATRAVLGLGGGDDAVLCGTPVLLEHSSDDWLVPVAAGHRLRDALAGFGAQVVWREYSEGGHWFTAPEGIDDAVAFLKRVLGLPADQAELPDAMDRS